MKKRTLSTLLTLALALVFTVQGLTRSGGAPSARNGSPASNGTTCNTSGCHTGGGSITNETITVTTNIPGSGYQANTTYQITVKADDGNRNLTRIGFEASVENNNGHIGTITSNGTRTKKTGSFITHTSSGLSPTNGVNTWTFDWNPGANPPASSTVYVAANFANGNFNSSGDVIGTQTLALSQAQNTAIAPFQSFETSGGNWNFTINPAAYNTEGLNDDFIGGSEDVWDSIQAFTGDIDTSSAGIKFWGMQDLDNGNGGGSFGHTIDFDPVDVSSYSNAAISFDYYTDGYDSSDSLAYVAEFDSLSTWGTKVLLQKNSDAWVNVTIPIPAGSSYARLRIYAKQNGGSDFAGIDNVMIDTAGAPPSLPVYNIAQVTTNDANGVADSLNVKCELRGTLFSIDFDGNAGYSMYMYDATGGINVFNFSDVNGYTNPQPGDSLRVFGDIGQFRGLTQMVVDSVIVASTGNSLKSPAVVSILDKTTEGEFIELQGFSVVNASQWPGSGSNANVDITNGTDTLVMRIDRDTDIDGSTAPTDTFDVRGAGGQFSFAANLDDGYQILPSSLSDIDTGGQGVITSPTYPLYTIASVTTNDANGVADSLNVKCELRGTLFSIDFDGNAGYSMYMYDATGGINVFNFSDVNGYTNPQPGDSLRVFGDIGQFRGLTQMVVDSVIVASTGNSLKSPAVVSTLNETTEGEYIELQGFSVVNASQWPGSGSNANVDITNGTDTLVMRIDRDTDIDGSTAPTDTFDVRGAGGQFSFAANLDDGYQILPSSLSDIDTGGQGVITSPTYPLYTIASVTTNDANGVADSLNVKCELRGTLFSIDFDGNAGYSMYMYDATGGINIFNFSDVNGYTNPQPGDSLRVFGDIGQFRGLTQMTVDSVIVASTGNSLKSPAVVSILDETTEGEYIELQGFTVVNASQWPGSGSNANVDITNGTDTLVMRIDRDTDIDGSPVPTTSFDVTGAGGQFSFAANLDDGYQILPSALADFTFATPTTPTVNFTQSQQTVLEDVGTVTVKMSISPALTAMDTLTLLALPSANLTPADGFTTPALDTITGLLSLPLAMGADSAFFDITVIDDAVVEGNETLSVSFFGTAGSLSLGSLNTFDFIIQDNDKVIPVYDIADVTTSDASGVADSLNVECKLNGTVFTTDFRGGGGYQFYIKDGTGGINVFNFNDVSGYTDPKMGDSLRVIGTIIQFNGLTEIQADSIVVLDTAQSLGQPRIVHDLTENEEGEYIRLNGWSLINPMNWPTAGNSGNLDITNGQDTLQIRIDSDTDIDGTTAPVGFFDVIGVGAQFDQNAPFTEGYQFFPSRFIDFTSVNLPTLSIREVMPNSNHSSPVDGDWFEVENFGGLPINLQGFSWDDESRERGKHSISSNSTIDPGESIVLVEVLSPDDTTWTGVWLQRGNGLQVLNEDDEFNGFSSLSSGGDEVNLYDDGQRLLSSVNWDGSAVTSGFSLEFDRNGVLQGASVDGVNGAYTSSQGDVGSPGDLSPVSLSELLAHNLELYPNPTNGILNIDAGTVRIEQLTVTSITGKKVRTVSADQALVSLDFSDLPKGVYLLQISAEGKTVTRKVVLR